METKKKRSYSWTIERRRAGNKSKELTVIRNLIRDMSRGEWKNWFRYRLDTLPNDTELWGWINRVPKYRKTPQRYEGRGRPNEIGGGYPDTRNPDYDRI